MYRHVIALGNDLTICIKNGAGIVATLFDVWRERSPSKRYAHLLSDRSEKRSIDFQGCRIKLLHWLVNVRYALACRVLSNKPHQFLNDKLKSLLQNSTNGSLWILQVQPTHSGLTTLLMPQTAVCGYFKSNLLGQANLMESVVPEVHTVLPK